MNEATIMWLGVLVAELRASLEALQAENARLRQQLIETSEVTVVE